MSLKQRITELERIAVDLSDDLNTQRTLVGDMRHDMLKLQNTLADYTSAVGPLWSTAAGHRRPLGMLSTDHLYNLENGGWLRGCPWHKSYVNEELERRLIDAEKRDEEEPKSLWSRFWGFLANPARSMGFSR